MKFFTIRDEKSLIILKSWLKEHRYNSYALSGKDKNGNGMITIRWDRNPDSDWGKPEKATGIILIPPSLEELSDKVEEVVTKGFSK